MEGDSDAPSRAAREVITKDGPTSGDFVCYLTLKLRLPSKSSEDNPSPNLLFVTARDPKASARLVGHSLNGLFL